MHGSLQLSASVELLQASDSLLSVHGGCHLVTVLERERVEYHQDIYVMSEPNMTTTMVANISVSKKQLSWLDQTTHINQGKVCQYDKQVNSNSTTNVPGSRGV